MACVGDSKLPLAPPAATSVAMRTVFGIPDLKGLIMEAAETPFCAEATKGGERCNRAWVYRNTLVPSEQLDCSQYCSEHCLSWMTAALQTPPRSLFLWRAEELLGVYEIKNLRLNLDYYLWKVDPDALFDPDAPDPYVHEAFECRFTDQSFQWYRQNNWKFNEEISATELAKIICSQFRKHGATLKFSTGYVMLPFQTPPSEEIVMKFRNAQMSFGDHRSATWIRPNGMWKQAFVDSLDPAQKVLRTEYRTTLQSWSPPEAIPKPKQGGNSRPRLGGPAIINTLF
jgi:hypothetical protein